MTILQKLTNLPDNQLENQIQDFDKRYRSTYLLYKRPGMADTGAYILKIRGPGISIGLTDTGEEFTIDGRTEEDLQPFLPPVGYYNVAGQAAFLSKAPQKQYKRSLCSTIYKLYAPNNQNAQQVTGDWSALVNSILIGDYAQLKDLTNPLFTNVALNRQFAITAHKGSNLLTYRRCPVGVFEYKQREILLTHKILEQEVKDLINKSGDHQWKLRVI